MTQERYHMLFPLSTTAFGSIHTHVMKRTCRGAASNFPLHDITIAQLFEIRFMFIVLQVMWTYLLFGS
jgi:hypothetical protein